MRNADHETFCRCGGVFGGGEGCWVGGGVGGGGGVWVVGGFLVGGGSCLKKRNRFERRDINPNQNKKLKGTCRDRSRNEL